MLSDILACLLKPLYEKSNENIEYTNDLLVKDLFNTIEEE